MMTKNNTPNPTDGRMKDKEVNAISDYLKPNMPLPQYLPYARFLLDDGFEMSQFSVYFRFCGTREQAL